ncbi:TPA: DUF957 domain-containing protein [Klebsiella pneumoniae]|nr:DUF957 domain-containing protein [Klebsiella pneumoniae]
MPELTTETALDILIRWLQDNIDCGSEIIFDNDEDRTDSTALLPWIEKALKDVSDLRHLQRKRTARTVLTGMCYSVGSVMRQGSSSLTRLTGQSAMTSRTWRR